MLRLVRLSCLVVAVSLLSGCAMFTSQNLGPGEPTSVVREGDELKAVLMKIGGPARIIDAGPERFIYIWHRVKRIGIMGFYEHTGRRDIVALISKGVVTEIHEVATGQAMAILGFNALRKEEM